MIKKLSNWEEEIKVGFVTSCKEAARLISLSFERHLTIREYVAMRLHLWTCKTCSFYKRQITALRQAFVRHEEVLDNTPTEPCDCLDPAKKTKIKELLKQND